MERKLFLLCDAKAASAVNNRLHQNSSLDQTAMKTYLVQISTINRRIIANQPILQQGLNIVFGIPTYRKLKCG